MIDKEYILNKVKTARLKRFISNCYTMNLLDDIDDYWELKESFIFSYNDHGVFRLVFFCDKWETLDDLLKLVKPGKWYFEYITNTQDVYIPNNGYFVARMLRLANPDCSSVFSTTSKVVLFRNDSISEYALRNDSKEITEILWNTFVPEISHLLYENELLELIDDKKITIHRTNGHIDALLQVDVMPKKFYINQIINLGERHIVHALLLNRLFDYVSSGGKYLYSWVNENNIASLKFHSKYGMEHDGVCSVIVCVEVN